MNKNIKSYDEFINEKYFFDKPMNKQKESVFISESEEYGSVEGIIHNDIEKAKNWFLNRNIDYSKYIDLIEFPVAFLNNINVEKSDRRRGYGNKLYFIFEDECEYNDVKTIILESDKGEEQVIGFELDKWYESFEYEKIGEEGGNSIMMKKI